MFLLLLLLFLRVGTDVDEGFPPPPPPSAWFAPTRRRRGRNRRVVFGGVVVVAIGARSGDDDDDGAKSARRRRCRRRRFFRSSNVERRGSGAIVAGAARHEPNGFRRKGIFHFRRKGPSDGEANVVSSRRPPERGGKQTGVYQSKLREAYFDSNSEV